MTGKQNSLFPAGPVINVHCISLYKCLVIPPDSKIEKKTAKRSFTRRRLTHKFASISMNTGWSRASQKLKLLFSFPLKDWATSRFAHVV